MDRKTALYVSVTESSTSSFGCAFTDDIQAPVTLARVERIDGDVKFIEHTQTNNCF